MSGMGRSLESCCERRGDSHDSALDSAFDLVFDSAFDLVFDSAFDLVFDSAFDLVFDSALSESESLSFAVTWMYLFFGGALSFLARSVRS